MDELNNLNDELALIISDIKSIENSQCVNCSYLTFRMLLLTQEESIEGQKQVNTSKQVKLGM